MGLAGQRCFQIPPELPRRPAPRFLRATAKTDSPDCKQKRFPQLGPASKLAPHDLRRTCARLCYLAGGELDQIQFLLGHASMQTTERYLGCKQRLLHAVNDKMGIEPAEAF